MKKLCVALLFLSFCLQAKVVNMALQSAPNNLNPFFSTDANSQNINRLVHKSLIDNDSKMNFICILCESFSEKVDAQGKHIFSFKLKKGLTFWDGTVLTSDDVKKSLKYFTDEENIKSIFRFAFNKIKEINIKKDDEFELVYENFSPENKSNLNLFKIIKINDFPRKIINSDIIGLGDYQILKEDPLSIFLKSRKPRFNDFNFKVVKDETTMALKFLREEVDVILANMSPRKIDWIIKKDKSSKIAISPSTNYSYIGINHKEEQLQNLKLRKALSLLVPREEIIKYKFRNMAIVSKSMFSPGFKQMHDNFKLEADTYNPKLAQELINSLGYTKDEKGFYRKDGKELSFNWIATNTSFPMELVKIIIDNFRKNGIQVELTTMEWGSFMKAIKQGSFDLFMNQWVGFTDPGMLEFAWHSEKIPPKGANRGFYQNKDFDSFIDRAITEADFSKALPNFLKALEIATRDYAYINLWHPHVVWLYKSCISLGELYSNGSFLALGELKSECE